MILNADIYLQRVKMYMKQIGYKFFNEKFGYTYYVSIINWRTIFLQGGQQKLPRNIPLWNVDGCIKQFILPMYVYDT